MQVFVRARQKLGEILSAFEFFDQQALDLTLKHLEGIRNPLPDTQTPFYLVVETSGSNEAHDSEKLQVGARPATVVTSKSMQHWLQMQRPQSERSLNLSDQTCHPTGPAPLKGLPADSESAPGYWLIACHLGADNSGGCAFAARLSPVHLPTISGCSMRMPGRLQGFLEEVMEEGMVLDGTIAQDSAQIAGIWGIREGISVALKHAGARLPVSCG